MKKIGVFTSGGDSPGMNACIRAVVRAGIYHKLEVIGIMRGYEGLMESDFKAMPSHAVSDIIQRGGTVLKTARSSRFMTDEGMEIAASNLKQEGIEALVAIGGDGTFRGAEELERKHGVKVIGLPGTIDNDLVGTDFTIGYDTAINTVVQAVDKIRDTATSHDRLFFVEVMGRDSGLIAMRSGIAVGAEAILVPEYKTYLEKVVNILERGWQRKKSSSIVIVAEGDQSGGAFELAKKVQERFNNYDTRVSVLGHLQRGGSPTCMDRVLASRLGVAAVEALLKGRSGCMVGIIDKELVYTPFTQAVKHTQQINPNLMRIAEILSL